MMVVIAHELSHIVNDERPWITCLSSMICFGYVGYDLYQHGSSSILSCLVYFVPIGFAIHEVRKHEKNADLKAVEALGTVKGLISYFNKSVEFNKEMSQKSIKYRLLTAKNGDFYGDLLYPLISTRINYLKKFERENNLG